MTQDVGTESQAAAESIPLLDDASVQQFLDRYAQALSEGDPAVIASMWEAPAFVLGDPGAHPVTSLDEVEGFFANAREQYRERGVSETRAEMVRLDWATYRIAIVKVRWPLLDEDGNEVSEELSTYTLRRDDNGVFKLRVAVIHDVISAH